MEVKRRTAESLVKRLNSAADADSAAEAIAEIRLLSKHDPEIRSLLADAGAVPILAARLLPGGGHNSPPSQENAAAALLNISISAGEGLMATPGLLDALAAALHPSSPTSAAAAQHAAATLYSLLTVDAYRPIIGSKRPLVASLIALLHVPNPPNRFIKDALKALFGVALYPLNRPAMVDLGVVPALFSLVVNDGRTGVVEDATAVIAQVAGCYESVDAFRNVAGVRVLVDLVDAGRGASGRASENAAAALLNLVMSGGEEAAADVREIEVAETALRELAGGGSSARAKSKAESLLKALDGGRGGRLQRFADFKTNSPPSSQLSTLSAATTVSN
ncbi:U-box domain-containing protein 4-like [Phoenix dactylifera]|uniref:U-box domain-containing protein 4-like n=1 Tax=Phoenix dactylifera TaxID=42345 RepID=A0A8B7CP71_PHODC|nr:U-box domain-containing protein 4-like [Phoenix dactylifera]